MKINPMLSRQLSSEKETREAINKIADLSSFTLRVKQTERRCIWQCIMPDDEWLNGFYNNLVKGVGL